MQDVVVTMDVAELVENAKNVLILSEMSPMNVVVLTLTREVVGNAYRGVGCGLVGVHKALFLSLSPFGP